MKQNECFFLQKTSIQQSCHFITTWKLKLNVIWLLLIHRGSEKHISEYRVHTVEILIRDTRLQETSDYQNLTYLVAAWSDESWSHLKYYTSSTVFEGDNNIECNFKTLLVLDSLFEADNNIEHSFKNCVSIRLAITGLMSTTGCSKLSQQNEVTCSHARNNCLNKFFKSVCTETISWRNVICNVCVLMTEK